MADFAAKFLDKWYGVGLDKDRWKIVAAMVVEIGGERAVRQLAARMVAGVGVGSFFVPGE